MKSNSVFIIAEIGVNHNGCLETAKKLIDAAIESGADAVKFQSFITEEELVKSTPKADYQKKTTNAEESQFDMVKKLELNKDQHVELFQYCATRNIEFISSPFDLPSIQLLNDLGVQRIKIPSGEITNIPYLHAVAKLNKPVILSTGMSTMDEVEFALKQLESAGLSKSYISILHCTSEYPAPMTSINLNSMVALKDTFGLVVGYSDHSLGSEVAVASVALGAKIIEKHITLDKSMAGPDHSASSEPHEFLFMVKQIRNIEIALGRSEKKPTTQELKTKDVVRKKIVAKQRILKGEQLSEKNLTTKRSLSGLGAEHWFEVLGVSAVQAYDIDDPIELQG